MKASAILFGTSSMLSLFAKADSSGQGLEVHDGFNINFKYDDQLSKVTIDTVQPDGSWFGLLLGTTQMVNADVIVMIADGAGNSSA